MKLITIIFISTLFLFQACSSEVTNSTSEKGGISFFLSKENIPNNVKQINSTLSRDNYPDIHSSININENSSSEILISDVPSGEWEITIEALNEEGLILFSGKSQANILPGILTPINVQLNPTSGGILLTFSFNEIDLFKQYELARFPFDNIILDMSSNQNNNAFFNGSFSKGIISDAINLNGINEYLSIPHIDQYHSEEKTIMFWMYKSNDSIRDTPGLDDVEGLVFKSYDTGFDRDFSFGISNNKPPFDIYVVTGNGNNNKLLEARSKNKIYPHKWYHVTGMIDKESIKLFINGELVSVTPFEGKINKNDAPIIIGKTSVKEFPTRYFNGKIDDFRIYNKILSVEEYYYLFSLITQ